MLLSASNCARCMIASARSWRTPSVAVSSTACWAMLFQWMISSALAVAAHATSHEARQAPNHRQPDPLFPPGNEDCRDMTPPAIDMTPMWFQAHGARLPDLESLPVDFSLSTRGRAELAG